MFLRYIAGKEKIKSSIIAVTVTAVMLLCFSSCNEEKEHIAPAIHDRDSVAWMVTYGVNTLISDSGIIRYRVVTERWEMNKNTNPTKWSFLKGVFLEKFDEKFHIEAYIQADTAWYYDTKKLWELRGRVSLRNNNGLVFHSEELFWNQNTHQMYSNKFSRVVTPERQLQGTTFVSDEQMTHYRVTNSKGAIPMGDMASPNAPMQTADTTNLQPANNNGNAAPVAPPTLRQMAQPSAAKPKAQPNSK